MRSALLALLAVLAFPVQAASVVVEKTISGFDSPESVVVSGDDVFVSNVGVKLEPFARDGDGYIAKLDRQGNFKTPKWADRLNAPKGMIAVNGVLYVADIDRVLGFRQRDGKRVFDLDLAASGAKFLNAFARYDDRRLLLSSTDLGKVFVIDLPSTTYSELKFDVPPNGPNGLKKLGGRLLVVEWGGDNQANGKVRSYRLDGFTATLERTWAPAPAGYFDGVVSLGANRWLISNWVKFEPAGLLQVLDTQRGEVTVASGNVPLAGPADLFLDDQGKLWVPGMLEGKVYRMQLRY